jgi:two-component system, OmpR family, alkaline phosphatase synthesis response regulator PhoP
MSRILIVEDEPAIALGLEDDLKMEGYQVEVAGDGITGARRAREGAFDLILLDVMLPGKDGFEVCRELRRAGLKTPILILTAKAREAEKVMGLELGADDYVTKPFSPRELLARVRAALRHTSRTANGNLVSFDGISIDFKKMEVQREGKVVVLTAQEFKTLQFLVQNADRVIGRDELLNEVWGYQNYPSTRTVDNHILKLRQKLERDPASPVHFRTVHGMGYKFVR